MIHQYTYRQLISWRDFPGRTGQIVAHFRFIKWDWLAEKIARALISHKMNEDMIPLSMYRER